MGTLLQDVRFALRSLAKNRGFAAVAVMTLALGIGANTAIFTVINAVLFSPLPVKDIARLYQMDTVDSKSGSANANFTRLPTSFPNYQDFRDQNQVFSGLASISFTTFDCMRQGEVAQLPGQLVTANYFDVLGVSPALGRTFFPDEDRKPGGNAVAVLSFSLWQRDFGSDPGVIGKHITLNAQDFAVVGVAARNFKGTFSLGDPNVIWVPVSMHDEVLSGTVRQYFLHRRGLLNFVFGRLKPEVTPQQAETAMKTIAARLERDYPNYNAGRSVTLSKLSDGAVGINQRGQVVLAGGVLMTVVGLVLLVACVNLANLLLARASRRAKEMGIRAALGAGRIRLVRQLLTESILLAIIGGAAGLLIASWGRTALWSFRPAFLPDNSINLNLDGRVLAFTSGLAILTGILFGMAPALATSSPDLHSALKVGGRGNTTGRGGNTLRGTLVIAELALSLIALVGAGLFARSMQNAQKIDPGFESQRLGVMAFNLGAARYAPPQGQQYYLDAVAGARAVPGVESAAVALNAPLGGGFLRTVFAVDKDSLPDYRGTLTNIESVSPAYFETLRIPLVSGRTFTEFDREGTGLTAIANQAMANHFWPGEDPIGKRWHFFGETNSREIVGVVRDVALNQLGEPPQPIAYVPIAQYYEPAATLQVRTAGDPAAVIAEVRNRLQRLDRSIAITNVNTIREIIDQGLWAARMGATLLALFGFLALLLAAVGLAGVMGYSVAQRRQEIGLRLALGAQPAEILRMVLRQGLILTLIGVAIGILAAHALARLATSLLYGVSAADPLTLVVVPVLLAMVALVACYVPARRAMRVDPLVALRYE
jgi:predicted permease